MGTAASDDLALVNASLNSDREAFAQIVTRYQALIASVAYSATGNLAESEDIASKAVQQPKQPRGSPFSVLAALSSPGPCRLI